MEILSTLAWILIVLVGIMGIMVLALSIFEGNIKDIIIGIAMLLPIIIVIFLGNQLKTESKIDYSYNIYALEDSSKVQGSRYYIQENDMYSYLADYKEGQKKYSVKCDEAYIVEDTNSTPHIDVFDNEYINPNFIERLFYGVKNETTEYKIAVPKKTLSTDFNVDLND